MKNNFITKIIGATLAFAMMIGGAVINAGRETRPVYATIDTENGYAAATMDAGTNGSTATVNGLDAIKVGSSKAGGDMSVTVPSGTTNLRFYAAAWKGVTGLSLNITKTSGPANATISSSSVELTADDGITSNSPFTLNGDEASFRFDLTLTNISTAATFKFETSIAKRFVMWSAQTKASQTPVPVEDGVTVSLDKNTLPIDLYNSTTGSLTATVATTGDATTGLSAISSNTSVATISTASPTSGEAFTVTAHAVGQAIITVKSTWDNTTSATCTVVVSDSTPRLANFKKANSLTDGQSVIITTVVNGDYYYLPSETNTSSAPSALECSTYNSNTQRITNFDVANTFTANEVQGGWQFKNSSNNYLYLSGNDNNRVRVGNTEYTFTVGSTENGYFMSGVTSTKTRYVGIYITGSDWRCYDSRTAANYKGSDNEYNCDYITFWVEAKLDQTITGASTAYTDETVELTSNATNPTWSIVAGDTTAEGAQVTSTGEVSATGAGTVKVKATHADYEDAFHTITFSVRPSESYINVTKESTTGFTGQNETLNFDFGNIENAATAISITSDDTSVVTVNAPSIGVSTGTVQINFVGAGETTVRFKDGETEKDTITVTVTQSSVMITGMPATGTVFVGNTLDLASQITITATGSYSENVTWESDDESVATVTGAGVVTGVAQGTANITVTSVSDNNVSATCAVTVSRILFSSADSFQNGKRYILATNDKYYLPAATQTVANTPDASSFNSLDELTKSDAWYASVDSNNHIVFSNKVGNDTFYLNAFNDSKGITIATTVSGYWTLTNDGYLKHSSADRYLAALNGADFRFYSNKSQAGASFVKAFYEYIPTAKEQVEETTTLSALAYEYQQDGAAFTYDNVGIRFGGFLSQTLWNQLGVVEYGVFLTESEGRTYSIEEDYEVALELENGDIDAALLELCGAHNGDTNIRRFYSSAAPTVATDEQKAFNGINTADVYYTWTIRKNVTNALTTYYSAVAYVRTATEIIFLEETSESAKHLATAALARTSQSDPAYESLAYFAAN